jgi:hypothetical protein
VGSKELAKLYVGRIDPSRLPHLGTKIPSSVPVAVKHASVEEKLFQRGFSFF